MLNSSTINKTFFDRAFNYSYINELSRNLKFPRLFYITPYIYIHLIISNFSFRFRISTHPVYARICIPEFARSPFSPTYIYIYIYVSFLFGCKSAGNFTIRMERRFAASLSSASTLRPPCIYTIVALYAWKLLTYADIRARRGGGEDGRRGGRLATRQME